MIKICNKQIINKQYFKCIKIIYDLSPKMDCQYDSIIEYKGMQNYRMLPKRVKVRFFLEFCDVLVYFRKTNGTLNKSNKTIVLI